MMPNSRGLIPSMYQSTTLQTTIRRGNHVDFKFELFPLHSPLLRESLLVSFPPLIYMLKFSGQSYLISGRGLSKFPCKAKALRKLAPSSGIVPDGSLTHQQGSLHDARPSRFTSSDSVQGLKHSNPPFGGEVWEPTLKQACWQLS